MITSLPLPPFHFVHFFLSFNINRDTVDNGMYSDCISKDVYLDTPRSRYHVEISQLAKALFEAIALPGHKAPVKISHLFLRRVSLSISRLLVDTRYRHVRHEQSQDNLSHHGSHVSRNLQALVARRRLFAASAQPTETIELLRQYAIKSCGWTLLQRVRLHRARPS